MLRRTLVFTLLVGVLTALSMPVIGAERSAEPLVVIVMDPLSAPLSCDCVKGYAQRKYETLGAFLTEQLGRPVKVYWSESLETALKEKSQGKADLIVGKHSVVLSDAKKAKLEVKPIASLTGKDGKTTQTGLVVIRSKDPAKTVEELKGYRIFFGPEDCDEKYAAPMKLLKDHGVAIADKPETYEACSDAAGALVDLKPDVKAAAVISSYAAPLLEGCGTVKKGDLRVIGTSAEIPFVTAFANASLPESERQALQKALLETGKQPALLISLETESGFVEWSDPASKAVAKKKD